jgi:hypothetical protein
LERPAISLAAGFAVLVRSRKGRCQGRESQGTTNGLSRKLWRQHWSRWSGFRRRSNPNRIKNFSWQASCQPGSANLHLAQAKCKLFPEKDPLSIYQEWADKSEFLAADHTAKCGSGGADMRCVDHGVLEAVAVKDLAAAAYHQGTWFLRRQPLAGLPHRIFARGPIALSAPNLESASLRLDRNARQATSKSALTRSKVAVVPSVYIPLGDQPG